jgi:hypothetical protein
MISSEHNAGSCCCSFCALQINSDHTIIYSRVTTMVAAAVTIKELWVYPVKACQGVQVNSANVTATG